MTISALRSRSMWFCGLIWSVKQVPVPPRLHSVTVKKHDERAAKKDTPHLRKVQVVPNGTGLYSFRC